MAFSIKSKLLNMATKPCIDWPLSPSLSAPPHSLSPSHNGLLSVPLQCSLQHRAFAHDACCLECSSPRPPIHLTDSSFSLLPQENLSWPPLIDQFGGKLTSLLCWDFQSMNIVCSSLYWDCPRGLLRWDSPLWCHPGRRCLWENLRLGRTKGFPRLGASSGRISF